MTIIKATHVSEVIESLKLVKGKKEKPPEIPGLIDKLKQKLDSVISNSTALSKMLDGIRSSIGLKTKSEKNLDVLRNLESTSNLIMVLDRDIVSGLARIEDIKQELRDAKKAKLKVVPKRETS